MDQESFKPPVTETGAKIEKPDNAPKGIDAILDNVSIPPELKENEQVLEAATDELRKSVDSKALPYLHPDGDSALMTAIRKKMSRPFAKLFSIFLAVAPSITSFEITRGETVQSTTKTGEAKTSSKLDSTKLDISSGGQTSHDTTISADYAPHFEAGEMTDLEKQLNEFAEIFFQNPDSQFIVDITATSDVAGGAVGNKKLSEERALKTKEAFINGLAARGVDMNKVTFNIKGVGERAVVVDENDSERILSGKAADDYAMEKLGVKNLKELHKLYLKHEKGEELPADQEAFLADFLNRDVTVSLTGQDMLHKSTQETPPVKPMDSPDTIEQSIKRDKTIIMHVMPDGRLEIFYPDQYERPPHAEYPPEKKKIPKPDKENPPEKTEIPKPDKKPKTPRKRGGENFDPDDGYTPDPEEDETLKPDNDKKPDNDDGDDSDNTKIPKPKPKPRPRPTTTPDVINSTQASTDRQGSVPRGSMFVQRRAVGGDSDINRKMDKGRRDLGSVKLDTEGDAVASRRESWHAGERDEARKGADSQPFSKQETIERKQDRSQRKKLRSDSELKLTDNEIDE